MLKQKYFLTDFFILSAEKQPIKLSWRNIEWLRHSLSLGNEEDTIYFHNWIYSFHMPLFIFLSGYFTTKKNAIKGITNYFEVFIAFHVYFGLFTHSIPNTFSALLTPNWIYWYLFSLICWKFLIKILPLEKIDKRLGIIITFLSGLLIGFVPIIGYPLSLSRTIVFFPFFLLGYYGKRIQIINKIKQTNIKVSIIVGICFSIICALIPDMTKIFAGSYPYVEQEISIIHPFISRIIFYTLALLMSFTIIKLCPKNKLLSELGQNSLLIYVYHSFFIWTILMLKNHIPINFSTIEIIIYSIFVITIIWLSKDLQIHNILFHPFSNLQR